MRYLLMCEGPNEETIINILLDNNKLKISRDDLIGLRPYNIRQLNNPNIIYELKRYNNPVIIYRIGDTQNDKIYKYCTKPGLEIIFIINENLMDNYEKVKSSMKPKTFAKKNIKFNGIKYDNSCKFYEMYYAGKNVAKLVKNLKDYKKYKKHNKDEKYLADLLK